MRNLEQLQTICNQFTSEAQLLKRKCLQELNKKKTFTSEQIQPYFHVLLFMMAYLEDKSLEKQLQKEMQRLSQMIRRSEKRRQELRDSGLPYTHMFARFTHELTTYLFQLNGPKVSADSFDDGARPLHDVLFLTLPLPEREHTNAEYSQEEILKLLGVKPEKLGEFLLDQVSSLQSLPLVKENVWSEIKAFFRFDFHHKKDSIPFNRLSFAKSYYTSNLIRAFDHEQLIRTLLPPVTKLSEIHTQELLRVIRLSMVLTMRETDPSTFTDVDSMHYYELERGLSVALYGMKPPHQLPMQSYIGYTLFKNGYPMAYGGCWVLGTDAKFGINIFEWFRGGESGFVFCQLLRVYQQLFHLKQIEIDAYQFGKDNPDGIRSGAFWFYYRYGFRPMNSSLKGLAEIENDKIQKGKGYRTREKNLIRLAEANMVWIIEKPDRMPWDYMFKVTRMINSQFGGNRSKAEKICLNKLLKSATVDIEHHFQVAVEWAVLAETFNYLSRSTIKIMEELIRTKSSNPYRYNDLLIQLLTHSETRPVNPYA